MAKIRFSSLISDIRGTLGSDVFSSVGPFNYVKKLPVSVSQPNTFRQMQIKSNLCYCSKLWNSVSPACQDLWQKYAGLKKGFYFGRHAFISLNCHLLNASHSDLTVFMHPPQRPSTPVFPKNFSVVQVSGSRFCLSWTSPLSSSLYVTAHYRLHKGFCLSHPNFGLCPTIGYRPSFRFIESVRSDSGYIVYDSDWPANTRLYFRLNSIDLNGRTSPFTHSVFITQV